MRKFRREMQPWSIIPAKYASVQTVLDADLKITLHMYQIQTVFFNTFCKPSLDVQIYAPTIPKGFKFFI